MVIDIVLVILFLIAVLWGIHKGGVKIIASLVSLVLALVLAYAFAGTIGEYIKGTSFGNSIQNAIETKIMGEENKQPEKNDEENKDVNIYNEEQVTENKTEVDINKEDESTIDKIEGAIDNKVDEIVNDGKEALATKIVSTTFYGIGFILTFLGVKLILFIAFLIVELIFKLPVLKMFNKLLGGALELVLMLVRIWIVLGLINFVAPLEFMSKVVNIINGSVITKLLYENNIIVTLIMGKII